MFKNDRKTKGENAKRHPLDWSCFLTFEVFETRTLFILILICLVTVILFAVDSDVRHIFDTANKAKKDKKRRRFVAAKCRWTSRFGACGTATVNGSFHGMNLHKTLVRV